jgi:hypothetical protein
VSGGHAMLAVGASAATSTSAVFRRRLGSLGPLVLGVFASKIVQPLKSVCGATLKISAHAHSRVRFTFLIPVGAGAAAVAVLVVDEGNDAGFAVVDDELDDEAVVLAVVVVVVVVVVVEALPSSLLPLDAMLSQYDTGGDAGVSEAVEEAGDSDGDVGPDDVPPKMAVVDDDEALELLDVEALGVGVGST